MIEYLKDWFENEWLYERHLTSEFIKEKEAFRKGCEYFDSKEYSFTGELEILLRKESGLAEVARVNRDLEKYATHCFRQIEKVLSEFILVNPSREKIGKYFLNGYDMILNPSIIKTLNPSVSDLLSHTNNNQLNRYCLILKINSIKLKYGKCERYENSQIHLTQKEENKIFKSILYFKTFGIKGELTENALKIDKEKRPSFWAFEHMYHLRNINSHLNSNGNLLIEPNYIDDTEKYRIQRFYSHPMEVLKFENESPGFYQRYVDMVLFLYSEYLKNRRLI
jgi:hypothetical protein